MPEIELRSAPVRKVTAEEWNSALQPETPPLPWRGAQGQRIFSFVVMPVPECSTSTTVAFMDAFGRLIDIDSSGPMSRMVFALDPILGETTFLPDPTP